MTTSSRHQPLEAAFDTPETKRTYVRHLFGTIAPRYDLITRVLSFGMDQRWKRRALDLADLRGGLRVLDLACGTGDLALLSARRGVDVVAVDLALPMLELARAKAAPRRVRFVGGDVGALPVASNLFDRVTVGYGLRNAPDLTAALAEIHRVLLPGGLLIALDFDRPESAWIRGVYLGYLWAVGGALGWLLHRDAETYRYIPASLGRYPGARGVSRVLSEAGFTAIRHVRVLGGLMAIHVAKKPRSEPAAYE